MMILTNIISKYVLFIGTFLLVGCANNIKDNSQAKHGKDEMLVKARTFKISDTSWGYEIIADTTIVIRQKFIPVIPGQKVFSSDADALKTGERVIYNLKNKQTPTLDSSDLIAIGIIQ